MSNPQAPVATPKPFRTETHGDVRIDDYHWLKEKENPDVQRLLAAENAYCEAILKPVENLRAELFDELKARIKEDDSDVPTRIDDYFYYTRVAQGQQYGIHCRKKSSLDNPEEILFDENEFAKDKEYFQLGIFETSPDHKWLAFGVDLDGSEKYTIQFKNLETGVISPEKITGAAHSLEWAEDGQTIFYTMLDAQERPDRLLRHTLGADPSTDVLVYKESDPQIFVYCEKTRSRDFIMLLLEGKITSEAHFLDSRKPTGEFQVIEPRRRGIEYSVAHHSDRFFIVTNDTVQNFRLVEAPVKSPAAANWKEIRTGSTTLFIEAVEAFEKHLVIHERENGLPQLRVVDLLQKDEHLIEFPEPAYSLGTLANPEFKTETLRFAYSSLITPNTVFDYHLRARTRETKKVQEIPSGYDKTLYRCERVMAPSLSGTLVPISLAYKVDAQGGFERNGQHPLYLYGYGSYGMSMPASFATTRLSLLDRGFVFAIAHIRGGSEMGRHWYDDGKFLKKRNTFQDFIASAEHLIQTGYTRAGEIAIAGGSAGGMLMGAVVNERPDLFKAAVAHVPFVDVVNTMLDSSLPLTTLEYDEWGNPNDSVYYKYIKSYSPYDNVRAQKYPHMLITSGLNDPRVTYWEPAKWVAKLREMKTDTNLLLQHINMGAGHGGPSGRYERLREIAMEYAFLLMVFGKA
jgi:oligopeptidase B